MLFCTFTCIRTVFHGAIPEFDLAADLNQNVILVFVQVFIILSKSQIIALICALSFHKLHSRI